jgi:cytochrome c peroxidase
VNQRFPFPHILTVFVIGAVLGACTDADPTDVTSPASSIVRDDLDSALRGYLSELGFTGRIASTLEPRLGRRIDHQLADLGRMLWFDPIGGLNNDNTCGGCHSPTHGFGDSQPIAIGIDNNGIVGPVRTGPRNQRRSPSVDTDRAPQLEKSRCAP